MDWLVCGEIPDRRNCDIKTRALQAGVDRTPFYSSRPCVRLRAEFEDRLPQLQNCGQTPDPKAPQIQRLNTEIDKLRHRLAQANTTIGKLADFRTRALARLAAQHEEIQAAPRTHRSERQRYPPATTAAEDHRPMLSPRTEELGTTPRTPLSR